MRAAYIRGSVLCAALLAGCFAAQAGQLADDPDAPWVPGLPIANSFAGIVELDSDPAGAEATTSLGGSCRTPCALELSAEGPFTVTFTREGYEPTTVEVKIQHARMGVSERKFAPNPVVAQLAAVAPPPPPPAPAPKKPVATAQPPKAAPRKPVAAVQPAAQPAAQPIVQPAAQPAVQPAAQPAARPVAAPSTWPAEVKPIPGINSGQIVPAAPPRSSDTPVARRWLENFKPASE
jgi:PEGA domain